jgi:glycosyltransferase involved in cell wall biosynthesis
MSNYILPKVLFIDTFLNRTDATGITLSNLFENWPNYSLYFITELGNKSSLNELGYNNIFILSHEEKRHLISLNYFQKKKSIANSNNTQLLNLETKKEGVFLKSRFKKINQYLKSFFHFMGFDLLFLRIRTTDKLIDWIKSSEIDYFYCVLSTRHSIKFALELNQKFDIPILVHLMDDWPRTIGRNTIFPNFWNRKINNELAQLLSISSKKLAISEEMKIEYENRFGGEWCFFHNVVDSSVWEKFNSRINRAPSNPIKIGYFGRIGKANDELFSVFTEVIINFPVEIEFHIYTDISKSSIRIPHSSRIFIHNFISTNEIPITVTKYDFLFLPLSFKAEDFIFSKFSFPTKFSEYLISGVPILLMAPEESAVYKFGLKHNCALLFNDCNNEIISDKLLKVIDNIDSYNEVSKNGIKVALDFLDKHSMGKNFIKIFEK